jgi:multidrug efflux pump subunit AcrB
MNISEYAVKNYQFTLVIFLMIMALGITTLLNMPRSEDPELSSPQFPIVVVYPGASPKDMEELVVDPIEKKISELEDVETIKTNINDGVAVLTVEYKYESDVEAKYQELIREVNSLRPDLPEDIYSLEVQKITPSNVNILQMALVSENAGRQVIRKEAERLQEQLEKFKELKKVEIHGLPELTIKIDLQLEKMAAIRVPINAVLQNLKSELANIPGGQVEAGERSFNIKTSGNYKSEEEIANTLVYSAGGKNVRLRDIATITPTFAETKYITRLNGHRCVFVTAALKPGNNISEVQKRYLATLTDYQKTLPANIELVQHFDQAVNVNNRLSGLGMDFVIAILLVAVTLLPLGGRAALVVMISIPLSLSIGLVLLNMLGYTLNQLSIVGLVVALGLLVDDSIVVVENIERWLRDGYSRLDATILATKQIGLAVLGCTVTLCIAFMPLLFLPEAAGDFIRSLPMGVITCVLASMLVSLTIIPFLSSRILKEHAGHNQGNIFLRALQKGIHTTYAPFLDKALKHPVITLLVAGAIFGASLTLFPIIGFSLFPASEKPQFLININAPIQTNLSQTNKLAQDVEQRLAKFPQVAYYATNVGKGNPRIYYNEIPANEKADFAQIFVQLQPNTNNTEKLNLIEQLRKEFNQIAGAKIEVKNFEQGPPVLAPVEVRLFGDNLDTLRAQALRVEQMLKTTKGAIYVTNPVSNLKSDIKLSIDKPKASLLGVPIAEIDRTVRLAIAGLNVGVYNSAEGDEYDLLVGTPKAEHATLKAFDNLYVNNVQGVAIPISQVASLGLESSPLTISHINKVRMVAVRAFVDKGSMVNDVINDVIQQMDKTKLPNGYTYKMGGEVESREKSFGGLGTILIITVFMFIAVLILEFGTFKSTLIVLSVIPLGVVGAVSALLISGNPLSFVAIIGLIALAGIEVKNSILLVDFTNQLREEGMELEEAIRKSGEIRFLPIILTSLTAIGGLMPIALSTNPLISPLAIVLIGGLISSTLLSRVVTPVLYKLIPPAILPKTKPATADMA